MLWNSRAIDGQFCPQYSLRNVGDFLMYLSAINNTTHEAFVISTTQQARSFLRRLTDDRVVLVFFVLRGYNMDGWMDPFFFWSFLCGYDIVAMDGFARNYDIIR